MTNDGEIDGTGFAGIAIVMGQLLLGIDVKTIGERITGRIGRWKDKVRIEKSKNPHKYAEDKTDFCFVVEAAAAEVCKHVCQMDEKGRSVQSYRNKMSAESDTSYALLEKKGGGRPIKAEATS